MSGEEQKRQQEGRGEGDSRRESAHRSEAATHDPSPVSRGSLLAVVIVVLLIAVIVAVVGILRRKHSRTELEAYTSANSAPPVTLETPKIQQNATEIVLP